MMAPKDKSRASGVSASSFLDLKAELAKQESEFSKNKGKSGQSTYIVGGVKKPDRVSKLSIYGYLFQLLLADVVLLRNQLFGPERIKALPLVQLGIWK